MTIAQLVELANQKGFWIGHGHAPRHSEGTMELIVSCGRWDRDDHEYFDSVEEAAKWIEESFANDGHGGTPDRCVA